MNIGDKAPSFALPDQFGTVRSLDELLVDGPIVLFFYPAANTPVCTAEACHFRNLSAEFAAAGASRIGISADAVETQAGFASKQGIDYPLLSDIDGSVAQKFGVKRGILGKLAPVKRKTFVIDKDRTILGIIAGEFRANVHADEALAVLNNRA
ncbi:peroxiredoxin [Hoyosella rhizosphaerae]|uniref:thioredoxin-dependent peroxiredoxin n=1 Tax=Hoyosella rhizosphaerae TaxID=1755582 RepID=A0A916UC84_9ACTN|nr:peroxiredoxin [Hoyosella rhizosphaerae]MBN4926078.1 peroxiredoxin [Hoyosella rhizosphaerae]GGC65743.1 putative peroxidoxin BcpB [Hoyosella rhizosphaerae]